MIDAIGWAATAIFLASYSCSNPGRLRLMQGGAALVWVGYGAMLHAVPIIVANLLVAAVAVYSAVQGFRRGRAPATAAGTITPPGVGDLSRISSPYS